MKTPDEEVLPRSRSATKWAGWLVALVAIVLIAGLTVAHFAIRRHASSARASGSASGGTAIPPGNDLLLPGNNQGFAGGNGLRIGLDAELISASDTALTVDYPIRLSGSTRRSVQAELTRTNAPAGISPPPPRLTRIGPHAHVALWMSLRIDCDRTTHRVVWPTAQTIVTIPLAGVPAPPLFSFQDLFGDTGFLSQPARLCLTFG